MVREERVEGGGMDEDVVGLGGGEEEEEGEERCHVLHCWITTDPVSDQCGETWLIVRQKPVRFLPECVPRSSSRTKPVGFFPRWVKDTKVFPSECPLSYASCISYTGKLTAITADFVAVLAKF